MADAFIQLASDGSGKKVDNESLVVGAETVHRQRTQVSGVAAAEIARVTNAPPTTEYGLVTRNIPSGTQVVDTELPAASTLDGNPKATPTGPFGLGVIAYLFDGGSGTPWKPSGNAQLFPTSDYSFFQAVIPGGQLDDVSTSLPAEGEAHGFRITSDRALHTSPRPAGTKWSETHVPAAATQATCAKAAGGSGVKNICTAITVTLASAALPVVGVVTFELVQDAAGTPVVLWAGKLSLAAAAGDSKSISVTGWWESTVADKTLTLRSTGAPPANVEATVAMSGHTSI